MPAAAPTSTAAAVAPSPSLPAPAVAAMPSQQQQLQAVNSITPIPQQPIPNIISPVKSAAQPTIIRMSSPMVSQGSISFPTGVAGVRPVTNIVRVRAPSAGNTATLASGQQIKVDRCFGIPENLILIQFWN